MLELSQIISLWEKGILNLILMETRFCIKVAAEETILDKSSLSLHCRLPRLRSFHCFTGVCSEPPFCLLPEGQVQAGPPHGPLSSPAGGSEDQRHHV